ncbi:MAG: D-glycero-beta-D-manno-heptose 1-phosphate adenylyltransferase [Chloroflexota bacterium]|nr:MAG: D-glycero-beta-D-manno-heptose 1-phosphate adenylyltransferase [Chloroflexota bacterium]
MTISRLLDSDAAITLRKELRGLGQRLVFTNGCFDILHVGHVRYLEAARSLGDVLLVALNSDRSVRALKGPTRPVQTASDRAEVLLALRAVEYVVVFDDGTAERLVRVLQPDVYVKGGDYDPTAIEGTRVLPEARVVAEYGGQVVIIPFVDGYSTTQILRAAERAKEDQ